MNMEKYYEIMKDIETIKQKMWEMKRLYSVVLPEIEE